MNFMLWNSFLASFVSELICPCPPTFTLCHTTVNSCIPSVTPVRSQKVSLHRLLLKANCCTFVKSAPWVRIGALDRRWHHFLGRVSMYLQIISSITSSAPPPIDINLPSLQEEPHLRWAGVTMETLGTLHGYSLTCRICWPAGRWWSPFLPRTAGSCRSPPWPAGRPLAWPWTPVWWHHCL